MRTGVVTAVAVAAIVIWGLGSRFVARAALVDRTQSALQTVVAVTQPGHGADTEKLELPGSIEAWSDASIYARTSGYLKAWYVDIGTTVKAGQLLAEIEVPDVDQQLRQAEANLEQARANSLLAASTAERWQHLYETQSVARQDLDDKLGDAANKKAALDATEANVQRLREIESFQRVLAPFDGVVTARHTDIGALINAGADGTPLFRVSKTDKVRVYVHVPQPYAGAISPDLQAELTLADQPGRKFPATLVSSAQAIDAATDTLLIQLEADNAEHRLLPGAYADVSFSLPARADALRLPANTLLFRSDGMSVATVGSDGRVLLKPVTLGRDFGKEVEIVSGLHDDDRVIVNPMDSIASGDAVRIAANSAATAKP